MMKLQMKANVGAGGIVVAPPENTGIVWRTLTMERIVKLASVALFSCVVVACGSESFEGTPYDHNKPAEEAEPPKEDEVVTAPEAAPAPTAPAPVICDEQKAAYEPQRPKSNIVFLLDRSGSMQIRLPTGGT